MLLHVIDDDPARLHALMRREHIQDQVRALQLVLEVRRVHEDQLVVLHGQIDVLLEHGHFVARVPVEPDFADPEDVGSIEKFGDEREHFARQLRSSASFGLRQSHEKCGSMNFAARAGSYSVSWR